MKSLAAWLSGCACACVCAFASACALTTGVAAQTIKAPALPGVRNIVLVHGAFTDGSSWAEVMELLRRKGYHVTAVQNPLTSLADDVKATRRVLARQIGPVLLVGHSWAGAVITEAGNQPNVRGLVYVSAFAPDSGESVAELLKRLNSPMEGLPPDSDGLLWLDDPVVYASVMAGDVPAKRVQSLAAAQQPMAANAFTEKVSQAAWLEKPSWYLVTNHDRALPPHVQRRLASEIQAETRSIDSSHMSMVSQPRLVADFIEHAARLAGR